MCIQKCRNVTKCNIFVSQRKAKRHTGRVKRTWENKITLYRNKVGQCALDLSRLQ